MTASRAHEHFKTRLVGGVPFEVTTMKAAAAWLLSHVSAGSIGLNVRLANAYNVALANSDEKYRDLLINAGINFPDGTPVVYVMNLGKKGRSEPAGRVRGPSLFQEALRESESTGIAHYFLGATPSALDQMLRVIQLKYPMLNISGSYSPPFAPIDDDYVAECAQRIKEAQPDLVWIGLGTPKQDVLGTELSRVTGLTTVNVGAAFDFTAGTVREAPRWIQNSGFEWFYRLVAEPKRLWKRYFFGNLRFMAAAIKHLIRSALGNNRA